MPNHEKAQVLISRGFKIQTGIRNNPIKSKDRPWTRVVLTL